MTRLEIYRVLEKVMPPQTADHLLSFISANPDERELLLQEGLVDELEQVFSSRETANLLISYIIEPKK